MRPGLPVESVLTPATILAVSLLVAILLAAIIWGPSALTVLLTPILMVLLTATVTTIGVMLQRQGAKTHELVNSRMTEMLAEIRTASETARDLAEKNSERRVAAARAEGVLEGKAQHPSTGTGTGTVEELT